MSLIIDIPNALTHTPLLPAQAASNNSSAGLDLKGFNGVVAVDVSISALTGTTPSLALSLQSSADTNVSNSVAFSPAIAIQPQTSNSNSALQTLAVDTRVSSRYLFAIPVLTGTNAAGTVAAIVVGQKHVH